MKSYRNFGTLLVVTCPVSNLRPSHACVKRNPRCGLYAGPNFFLPFSHPKTRVRVIRGCGLYVGIYGTHFDSVVLSDASPSFTQSSERNTLVDEDACFEAMGQLNHGRQQAYRAGVHVHTFHDEEAPGKAPFLVFLQQNSSSYQTKS